MLPDQTYLPNTDMADSLSPGTPTKVERIPKEDSFKTCKATMPSPKTRRQLRMTPARTSILSGGKPFKEGNNSGRKFNSRPKRTPRKQGHNDDDSAGSNETFIRCEQDNLFDHDSLEEKRKSIPVIDSSISNPQESQKQLLTRASMRGPRTSTPTIKAPTQPAISPIMPKEYNNDQLQLPPKASEPLAAPENVKKQNHGSSNKKIVAGSKSRSPIKKRSATTKSDSTSKVTNFKAPNFKAPITKAPQNSEFKRKRTFVTPMPANRPPWKPQSSFVGTASKYLSQCNNSRITRTQSFKSTAELERDYFNSLRSF